MTADNSSWRYSLARLAKPASVTRLIVTMALVLGPWQAGGAAELTAHQQAAADYLEATEHRARIGRMLAQVRAQQIAALGKWYVPADIQGPAQDFVRRASALIARELDWDRLRPEFIAMYASVYSIEELRGLAAFYRSELGRKYLEKRPKLVAEGLQITERRLAKLLPELEELNEALVKKTAAQRENGAQR